METKLYKEMMFARLNYLEYVIPIIENELTTLFPDGICKDDTWKLFSSTDIEKNNDVNIRRKLLLLVHPDKCREEDSNEMFIFVSNSPENILKEIWNSNDKLKEIRKNMRVDIEYDLDEIESRVLNLENSVAFIWRFGDKSTLLTIPDYERKKQEILKQLYIFC